MYKGFSMTKYKKIMEKLDLNAPTHKATMLVSYNYNSKTYSLALRDVPIHFEIIDINVAPAGGSSSYLTRKYQVILNKKYIEGKMLEASDKSTLPLLISKFVVGTDNGGYSVKFTLKSDSSLTPIDEEGYDVPQFEIKYGDYSDGAYRQYLELNSIYTIIY